MDCWSALEYYKHYLEMLKIFYIYDYVLLYANNIVSCIHAHQKSLLFILSIHLLCYQLKKAISYAIQLLYFVPAEFNTVGVGWVVSWSNRTNGSSRFQDQAKEPT